MNQDTVTGRGWVIVAMLFLFMLINFADKAVIGLSAEPIMTELRLDHTQFGLIGTSFFAFFSLSTVIIGFLVNWAPTRWVLVARVLAWSAVQLPMILPVGLAALVANRMLLGLAEGPAYPVALHAVYKWFPNPRRPLPTGIVAIGGAFGVGIVAPSIVYVITSYSWHTAFALLGLVGLVWCVVWLLVGREGSLPDEPIIASARIPYRSLLGSHTFIGQAMVAFAAYWLLTLAVVWLPAYLTKGAGYTPTQTGWIVTLPALAQIVLMPSACALSEVLKRNGISSRISRGGIACGGLLISGVLSFVLPLVPGGILPVFCTALAFSFGTLIFSLGHVMVAEISPASQRGSMLAINNAIATLAGPLAPALMGLIVDSGDNPVQGFRIGFMLIGASVALVSVVAWMLIDPEADRLRLIAEGGASRRSSQLLAQRV